MEEEVILVNPGETIVGNPFTSGLIQKVWEIFKSMGGRSPALDPDLWRKAFAEARAELGATAFHGWYDNPIWVRGYTRRDPRTGEPIHVGPYPRLTIKEIKKVTGGVPVKYLRIHDPEKYREYLAERDRLLKIFTEHYPTYEAWVAAGKPRGPPTITSGAPVEYEFSPSVRALPGFRAMFAENPFAKGFISEVWRVFKSMGGRSPALDPDLWSRAFHEVQAKWGHAAFVPWHNPMPNPMFEDIFAKVRSYTYGIGLMEVAAGLGGFWFANYLPLVTKWDKGWQGVFVSGIASLIAGFIAERLRPGLGMYATLGGLINTTAKALKIATKGKVTIIEGIEDVEDIEDIGDIGEEEIPEELLGEIGEEEEPELLGDIGDIGEEEDLEELLDEVAGEEKKEEAPVLV